MTAVGGTKHVGIEGLNAQLDDVRVLCFQVVQDLSLIHIYILIQVAAVNAALNSFNKELLGEHIRNCVVRDIREGKDETIEELVVILQKLMK